MAATAPLAAKDAGEGADTASERHVGPPVPAAPTHPAPDPAAVPVIARLAAQMMVEPEAIAVVSVEPAEWPDACLGLPADGEVCASVVTPGYAVVLALGGDTYAFRTDLVGERIRIAAAPPARTGDPLVTWRDSRSFNMMIIGTQRVAIGRRGRPLIAAPLAVPARAAELQEMLARYAPFQVQTPAGEVALRGVGASRPSETEQRMIAEWARIVSLEARAGGEQAEAAIALAWRGAPDATGARDQIEVTRTGRATATNIRQGGSSVIASFVLAPEDLAMLYRWLDRFEPFEEGALGGDVVLRSGGVDEATEADRATLHAWIDSLARRLREAALR